MIAALQPVLVKSLTAAVTAAVAVASKPIMIDLRHNLEEMQRMREDVESFRARVQTQSFELDRLQQYSRKDNIRVYGIDETADECTNTIIVKAKKFTHRAVANGPVGPAMAGPIIEPANFILFMFLNLLLYFLAGIIIEPGFFSILFVKHRQHSRQNVHSDDSILGRFRPSHAGSHHDSMSGKGPQVHEFVSLYSEPQCDAGNITAVVFICVIQIEPTSEQVSQTVLQVSQTVLRWSWQHEWTENLCC